MTGATIRSNDLNEFYGGVDRTPVGADRATVLRRVSPQSTSRTLETSRSLQRKEVSVRDRLALERFLEEGTAHRRAGRAGPVRRSSLVDTRGGQQAARRLPALLVS